VEPTIQNMAEQTLPLWEYKAKLYWAIFCWSWFLFVLY